MNFVQINNFQFTCIHPVCLDFLEMAANNSKKKGRVVPSRYKQAAEKVSIAASIRDKSTFQVNAHSRSRSLSPRSPALRRGENSKLKIDSSTPASGGQSSKPFIDDSAISSIGVSMISRHSRRNSDRSRGSATGFISQKSSLVNSYDRTLNQRKKEFEDDISILYCEYLQAKFLESCTIKSVQTRCEDATERIYKVWCYIQYLLGKISPINKDLSLISYYIQVYEHLNKQEKIILPMIELIPLLEKKYEKISEAVHRARHNLEVKDILVLNEDCKVVTELLKETSLLLNSIKIAVGDCNEIVHSAGVKLNFLNQAVFISDELKSASDMLSEASNELITEMSLKLSLN